MMGAEPAVKILYGKELSEAKDPDALRHEKIREYEEKFCSPYFAASKQYVDAVIRPADTRRMIIKALVMLEDKEQEPRAWKKHGNIPV